MNEPSRTVEAGQCATEAKVVVLGSAEKQPDRTEGVEAPCWQGGMTRYIEDMSRKSNEARRDASASEFIWLF